MPDNLFLHLVTQLEPIRQTAGLFLHFVTEHIKALTPLGVVAWTGAAILSAIVGNHAWEGWKAFLRWARGGSELVTVDKAEFVRLQRNAIILAETAHAIAIENTKLIALLAAASTSAPTSTVAAAAVTHPAAGNAPTSISAGVRDLPGARPASPDRSNPETYQSDA